MLYGEWQAGCDEVVPLPHFACASQYDTTRRIVSMSDTCRALRRLLVIQACNMLEQLLARCSHPTTTEHWMLVLQLPFCQIGLLSQLG